MRIQEIISEAQFPVARNLPDRLQSGDVQGLNGDPNLINAFQLVAADDDSREDAETLSQQVRSQQEVEDEKIAKAAPYANLFRSSQADPANMRALNNITSQAQKQEQIKQQQAQSQQTGVKPPSSNSTIKPIPPKRIG